MNRDTFHKFYIAFLFYLKGKAVQGAKNKIKVVNYLLKGQKTGNPRRIYLIENEILYIEEISGRNIKNQCTEEELYEIYTFFSGDVNAIKSAMPRKEKVMMKFTNFIEFKKPILIDMIENFLPMYERILTN